MKATQSCKILPNKYYPVSEGQSAQLGRHRIRRNSLLEQGRDHILPGERRLISRRNRSAAGPYFLDPRAIRGINFLNVVTFHSWRIVDISVRIRETKKRHSLDRAHWPRLGGNRHSHYTQDCADGGCTKLDHFGIPLFR